MISPLKFFLTLLVAAAMVVTPLIITETAFASTGSSTVIITPSELNITAGQSAVANFTVKLTTGTTWGTSLAYNSPTGITLTFNPNTGDPTFSGKVDVSVAQTVAAGSYVVKVYATGDDPSGDTNLLINVSSAAISSGTSVIELSATSANITQGGTTSVGYTVKLTSGTAGNTTISYISPSGIKATFSKLSGVPTFNGTMTLYASQSIEPGSYIISLSATGTDPSKYTNFTLNVVASAQPKLLTLYSEKTIQVNANNYISYTVSVNTPGSSTSTVYGYSVEPPVALISYTLTVIIPAGTYALINNTKVSQYNFTLATFNQNSSFPAPSSNYTVDFFWLFEVNGQVSSNITFVNSSGDAVPLITEINAPSNWTSYTYLGGSLIDNGQYYNFAGGYYAFPNTWTFNSTTKELVNDQFISPVPWVFVQPANSVVTSSGNKSQSTSGSPPYSLFIVAAIIILVIIVAVLALVVRSRKKNN